MELIARDTDPALAHMLDSYEHPAILLTPDYRILATNDHYQRQFGPIAGGDEPARCYRVSHNYDRPCDQEGEECPLAAASATLRRQRVLHIHQTPRGEEHVDVELLPIPGERGEPRYFVELLKPLALTGTRTGERAMVGASPAFNRMLEMVSRVGPTEAAVLLLGESGSGKELAARALHRASGRRDRALVTLECAGLSESVFESELFGHVRGAFTGANYSRQGLAEAADGGTLFLDEVGDIPLPLQVKLLRLIETGTFRPVGSTEVRHADFRLVCATHRDLGQMVEEGSFRQDLFYRINVFPIHLPSLRERLEDLPLLVRALLREQAGEREYRLSAQAMALLHGHPFRGNIRELRNILARALVLTDSTLIEAEVIARCLGGATIPDATADQSLKAVELRHLRALMRTHGGDREKVAAIAGISVRSLYRKLHRSRMRDAGGKPSAEADGDGEAPG